MHIFGTLKEIYFCFLFHRRKWVDSSHILRRDIPPIEILPTVMLSMRRYRQQMCSQRRKADGSHLYKRNLQNMKTKRLKTRQT